MDDLIQFWSDPKYTYILITIKCMKNKRQQKPKNLDKVAILRLDYSNIKRAWAILCASMYAALYIFKC